MRLFKHAGAVPRRRWLASIASAVLAAFLMLGAGVFPGSPGGHVHAAEKEKTFCEKYPYDVTCSGATCDIYTQYCPPWPGGATGGGSNGNNTWTIPRNPQNPYAHVACTASRAERESYALLAIQAHLRVIDYYGGLASGDPLFVTFADGLVRTYFYAPDAVYPVDTAEIVPCESPQGLPPVLHIP